MTPITTHVLDTVLGRPAAGVGVRLDHFDGERWRSLGASATDADGRCRDLPAPNVEGIYRLSFATGDYLARAGRNSIYPEITVTFRCGADPHYHLPLLLADNGYTTYRGS